VMSTPKAIGPWRPCRHSAPKSDGAERINGMAAAAAHPPEYSCRRGGTGEQERSNCMGASRKGSRVPPRLQQVRGGGDLKKVPFGVSLPENVKAILS
jgi:hypothetical protein